MAASSAGCRVASVLVEPNGIKKQVSSIWRSNAAEQVPGWRRETLNTGTFPQFQAVTYLINP